jgi:hypothetical protein
MKMNTVTTATSLLNKVSNQRISLKMIIALPIATRCLLFGVIKINLKTVIQKILNNRNKQQSIFL